jgi:hypothetical protein
MVMGHEMERQIIDAASGEITILEIDEKELKQLIGDFDTIKSIGEITIEKEAAKNAALEKLINLGFTHDEAKSIITG